jgi:DNA-binding transcriptional ArsR family regulator
LTFAQVARILKYMLQHSNLDRVFHALADPTRRAVLERLMAGPASISELATPFPVSLSAIGQHIQLLETSGLVRTSKTGRVRTVELAPETLEAAEQWFTTHRSRWERRFDRLGALLSEPEAPPRKSTRRRKS